MRRFKLLYVYILKCADDSYYVGVTNDLEKRLDEHNSGIGAGSYTAKRLPVKMVFWEPFNDYKLAMEYETKLKKWSREKKEALIDKNWERLKGLAECRNETTHKRNRIV
jgi:putative endonuclease